MIFRNETIGTFHRPNVRRLSSKNILELIILSYVGIVFSLDTLASHILHTKIYMFPTASVVMVIKLNELMNYFFLFFFL